MPMPRIRHETAARIRATNSVVSPISATCVANFSPSPVSSKTAISTPMAPTAIMIRAPATPPLASARSSIVGSRRSAGFSAKAATMVTMQAQKPAIDGDRPSTRTAMIAATGRKNISDFSLSPGSSFCRWSGGVGSMPRRRASWPTATNRLP